MDNGNSMAPGGLPAPIHGNRSQDSKAAPKGPPCYVAIHGTFCERTPMQRSFPATCLRALLAALSLTASAASGAPTVTTPQDPRDVARVPGRDEKPRVVFPEEEGWFLVERQADARVATATFQAAAPRGHPPVDLATVTVLRDIWNADLEKAQHQFGRQLSAECEGVRARLLRQDSTTVRRRLVHWDCGTGEHPFTAIQLLLQGRDDLFSVELFSRDGQLSDGLLVRWSDWLWEVEPCLDPGQGTPCPPDNWDRLGAPAPPPSGGRP